MFGIIETFLSAKSFSSWNIRLNVFYILWPLPVIYFFYTRVRQMSIVNKLFRKELLEIFSDEIFLEHFFEATSLKISLGDAFVN